jgi:hypothetical protein
MANYEIGSLISFKYPVPPPPRPLGTSAHDMYPQVLVLHPAWDRWPQNNQPGNYLLHGIAWKLISDDEKNVIRMIMSPKFETDYKEALRQKDSALISKFERIMGGAANANITSPHDFYLRVVSPFLNVRANASPYRLYNLKKISNVRILQTRQYLADELGIAGQENLFSKYARQFQNFVGGQRSLPRPPTRFPSKFPQFGGPHKPGALPGTEE